MSKSIETQLLMLAFYLLLIGCSDEPKAPAPQDSTVMGKLIAHRGLWNVPGASQNSLASLQLAFASDWFIGAETDIYETSDGYFVLYHDMNINGIPLTEMPLKDIQSHKLSNGETIPTFDEALELLSAYPNKYLMLDLKGMESEDFVEYIKDYPHKDQLIYKSFSTKICRILREADLSPVYLITWDISEVDLNYCIDNGLSGVSVYTGSISEHPQSVEEYHRRGLKYLAWSPAHYNSILEYLNLGADMVVTDWIPYYSEQ